MRVDCRVAQARRDQLLELLGEHVLEHLGLGVHAIPGHPELLGQEQLEQPVVAQHLKRDPATLVGEPHAVVGLVLDQPHLGELAHHRRDRARRDAQPLGQLIRRYRAALAGLQRIDRLGIVLNGGGNRFRRNHRRYLGTPKSVCQGAINHRCDAATRTSSQRALV